jgi:hypothetical protein
MLDSDSPAASIVLLRPPDDPLRPDGRSRGN